MPKLTKQFVDSVAEPGYYRDSELKGFVLKVTAGGGKRFLVNTKLRGTRKNVTVTLNSKEGVLTPAMAREKAKEVLRQLNDGIHPNEARREAGAEKDKKKAAAQAREKVESVTLQQAFDDYLDFKDGKLKENTVKTYNYVFNARFSDWADTRLVDITDSMVLARHREISKRYKGEADHAMRILRAVFIFSMDQYLYPDKTPLIKANPTKRLKDQWNKLNPRTDAIREIDLKFWCQSVQELDNKVISDFLLFLLFTGLRKNEAAKLKFKDFANLKADDSYVDRRAGYFLVKNTKNGRDHSLPLTDFLQELIERRWQERTNDYVFPGMGDKGHLVDARFSVANVAARVQELTGDKDFSFTPHSLRRTFITIAKRMGIDQDFVRGLANHKTGDVSSIHYTAMDDEDRLATMQRISDWIVEKGHLKEARPLKKKPLKVVSLSKAK